MKKSLLIGNKKFQYLSLISAIIILSLTKSIAQISLTTLGAAYTQNFNGLATTGTSSVVPTGWAFSETPSNTSYSAGTGSSATGDTYSFGSAALPSDRAFGTLLSGSTTSTLGASFTNNTGSTITSLNIAYVGEQWRCGAASRQDRLDFEYSLNATSLTSGSWVAASALSFTAPITTAGTLDGNLTANRTSISSTIGSLSIAVGGTVWIRWTDFNATGSDDGLAVDDFTLTPNGATGTPPTQLAITSINPASPLAGNGFSVTVQSQDGTGAVQNVLANTVFSLSTNGNAGSIGGTITGTINAGSSSAVVSGVTLATAGTGVNITATRTSGDVLTAGTSANFTVIGVATQLVFVSTPALGFPSLNMANFTIEARRADNSVDNNYTGSIIVSKASGPGSLSGTTAVSAVAGVATFTALQFNQTGVYTLNATSGALTPTTSSSINISSSSAMWDFTSGSAVATGVPANLTVSALSQGNNNGTTPLITSTSASSGYPGASGTNNAGAAARTGALVTGSGGSAYFEFTLTPSANKIVTLKGLTFGSRSTGTGPTAFSVRSSADNFSSAISSATTFTGTWALSSPSFSATSSGVAMPITFRIYGYNGAGSAVAGTANWRVDDIMLDLLVQQCAQPTITANSGAICTGNSFTITPNGGVSYTITGGSYTVSPTTSTDYTVTGVDNTGCTNTSVSSVSVNALPNISVNSGAICTGNSFTMSPTGGTSYVYSSGTNVVSPTANTDYTVTGTDANSCSNTAVSSVSVNALPTVSVSANPTSICSGSSSTLTASGALSYLWNTGATTTALTVNPTGNTSYTVTGVDGNNCSNTDVVSLTVNSLPSVSINPGSVTICSGTSSTLTANGALSYLWNTGATTTALTVNPTANTTYTVTGTDGNGCTNTAVSTVSVILCSTSTVPCGKTFYNMALFSTSAGAGSTSAVNVPGATSYRFNFYDNSTNALVGTKTQASRTCTFSTIPGIYYGKTYKWTVAVDKGTGFGAESSMGCTITFTAPQTNVPCGTVFTNLNAYTTCQIVGKATGYRFTIYNSTTNAVVAVKTQASNYLYFNTVSGLMYGNTYKLTAEAQYDNAGTGSLVYGPASSNTCTITFAAPVTNVPCGNTYAINGYSGLTPAASATGYRWSFYDATTMALVAQKTNSTQYVYFQQVPGLVFNKAYKWTVEVQYNNGTGLVFGPASSNTCTMNYGTPSSFVTNEDNSHSSLRTAQIITDTDVDIDAITVYPNPTKDKINVAATTVIKTIRVYNITGELVLTAESTDEVNMSTLKSGLYSVSVETENNTKHFKIIKE